jgi:type II secretory pathway component PulJ
MTRVAALRFRRSGIRGMTVVEIAVSTALFAMVFVGTWRLLSETATAMEFAVTGSSVGTTARRALDRMAAEIRQSGFATTEPPVLTICHKGRTKVLNQKVAENHLDKHPGDSLGPCDPDEVDTAEFTDYVLSHTGFETTTTSALEFQARSSFLGGPEDWSTPITFALLPSTGEMPSDNDGDGQVDEQRLVRTQDGVTETIADGLAGLSFTHNAGESSIILTLTLARTSGSGKRLSHTLTTRIGFWNLAR